MIMEGIIVKYRLLLSSPHMRFIAMVKVKNTPSPLHDSQLASQYREIAEVRQNKDWEAVERSASSEPIKKRYHVILHYERIIKAESKFEAHMDTLLGNTVVENAKVTLIEIDPNLPVQPLT